MAAKSSNSSPKVSSSSLLSHENESPFENKEALRHQAHILEEELLE